MPIETASARKRPYLAYDSKNTYLTPGDLLAYDAQAATSTAQTAQTKRVAAAQEAHAWATQQQAARPGQTKSVLLAEYMRRAVIVDAAYEVAVEPHRQAFLEQYPGVALPGFLQPGVRSFARQLQMLNEGAEGVGTAGAAELTKKRGWAGMSWIGKAGAIAIAAVALFIAAGLALSLAGPPPSAERVAADKAAIETLVGPDAKQKAEGFEHAGNGVLVRWATPTEERAAKSNCISGLPCFAVAVEMNDDCPGGIYIELKLRDNNGTIVGLANEKTPAMRQGDKGVFAITGATKASKASFGEITCH